MEGIAGLWKLQEAAQILARAGASERDALSSDAAGKIRAVLEDTEWPLCRPYGTELLDRPIGALT